MTKFIQQEISRILKNKQVGGEQVNFSQLETVAGNTNSKRPFFINESSSHWILDTGATTHICATRNLFHILKPLPNEILIHLPDGKTKPVRFHEDIYLHESLILKDVLYIPTFKHNLLSVSKLSKSSNLKFIFFPTSCVVQDLRLKVLLLWEDNKGSYVF